MNENKMFRQELTETLKDVDKKVGFCAQCFRSIEIGKDPQTLCSFCTNSKRDTTLIAVIEKEADMQNMEKTSSFYGLYHILNGTISPLDSESTQKLHLKELYERVKNILEKEHKCEMVLATNSTTEGDTTALYIERIFLPLKNIHPILKITRLGRGLSLGSELEYADEITLKNAFTNRK